MRLYIDTYGHNRAIWRNAGHYARIAAHTPVGTVELMVDSNGNWSVHEGPPGGQAGSFRSVAHGRYGEAASVAT